MGKVLIIGAGGVGTVVAHKVAQNPDVFTEIMIASRTKSCVHRNHDCQPHQIQMRRRCESNR